MLTDKQIRAFKPGTKPYKRHHRDGLFIVVEAGGRKVWSSRWKSAAGEQSKRHEPSYPEIGVAAAYRAHCALRDEIAAGREPGATRRAVRENQAAAGSYLAVANEWLATRNKWSGRTRSYHERWLRYSAPIHHKPISAITVDDVLPVLRRLEADSAEVAARVLMQMGRVFKYALRTRRCAVNVVDGLGEVLTKPQGSNLPALPRDEVGQLLRDVRAYPCSRQTFLGFHLAARTWTRSSEVRLATPEEFDLKGRTWTIPAERMKNKVSHIIPIAPQVMQIVRELLEINAGSPFLLVNSNDSTKPLSDNCWQTMLRRLGYAGRMCTHGWRSIASTICNEQGFASDAVERQLAHLPRDKVRARYMRSQFLEERTRMLTWWNGLLDDLEQGKRAPAPKVTAISRRAA